MVMTIFTQQYNVGSVFAVQNLEDDIIPCHHLPTCMATVTDGYVVLILALQLQTVDISYQPRKDKFSMVNEICNQ